MAELSDRETSFIDSLRPHGDTGHPEYRWAVLAVEVSAWRPDATGDLHLNSMCSASSRPGRVVDISIFEYRHAYLSSKVCSCLLKKGTIVFGWGVHELYDMV